MEYPTRENMQRSADYYANYGALKPRHVGWILAMYDALDAKQVEIDGLLVVQGIHRDAANTILDVNFEIQSELDKAKDLVRRMLPYVELAIYGEMTPVHYCDECKTIEPRHDAGCGVGKLIAEARKILEVPDAENN